MRDEATLLWLTAEWATTAGIELTWMLEFPEVDVKTDIQDLVDESTESEIWSVETLDSRGNVLSTRRFAPQDVLAFHRPGERSFVLPISAHSIDLTLDYPLDATSVRFRRGETIDRVVDPVGFTLRTAILCIPRVAFGEHEERRNRLLADVDAIEARLAVRAWRLAAEQIRHGLRDRVQSSVVDYGHPNTFGKQRVLDQLDRIAARLELRAEARAP